ncbi:MAG: hypothetical protein LBR85_03080 [Oscillospiraceae bacterium]|jgi:hypothetical protein|nr:hypothetical protein [Oscillospiraceae bacterium]
MRRKIAIIAAAFVIINILGVEYDATVSAASPLKPLWSVGVALDGFFGDVPADGQTQEELSVDDIRGIVWDYIPRYGQSYLAKDIPFGDLHDYGRILDTKGFDYESVLCAAEMSCDVQLGETDTMQKLGFQKIVNDRLDNVEYQIGFMDSQDGALIALSFNKTDPISLLDWFANADSGIVDGVHNGYREMAEKLIAEEDDIKFTVRGKGKRTLAQLIADSSTRFFLTGHSMGGAIVQNYIIHLLDSGVHAKNIHGITFNSALAVTEYQRYYGHDLCLFNVVARSDNVSAGAIFFSLGAEGRRLGYDVPLNDPNHINKHYVSMGNTLPNQHHHMKNMLVCLNAEDNCLALLG